jgi:group I intron endonuclease
MLIYKISNTINNKVYIGRTCFSIETRFKQHVIEANGGCNYKLHAAMRKYGIDKFSIEIIDIATSIEELKLLETKWIQQENSFVNGYNATDKQGGISSHTTEAKQKMRLAKLGKPLSEKHKQALSKAIKGRVHSDTTRALWSKNKSGKTLHENTQKAKMDALCLTWKITTPSGAVVIIINLAKYCRDNNLHAGSMGYVADGTYTQHKGYLCEKLYDKTNF